MYVDNGLWMMDGERCMADDGLWIMDGEWWMIHDRW